MSWTQSVDPVVGFALLAGFQHEVGGLGVQGPVLLHHAVEEAAGDLLPQLLNGAVARHAEELVVGHQHREALLEGDADDAAGEQLAHEAVQLLLGGGHGVGGELGGQADILMLVGGLGDVDQHHFPDAIHLPHCGGEAHVVLRLAAVVGADLQAHVVKAEPAVGAAGFAYLTYFYSCEAGGTVVMLEELFVKEALRGQGIGQQFFQWLYRQYPDAVRFRLEVTHGNPAARLYERNGFQRMDYDQMVYDVN